MILIVSFPGNPHVEQVLAHLRTRHVVVDQADFPLGVSLVARAGSHAGLALRTPDAGCIDLDAVRAVWIRRIHPFALDPRLDEVGRQFAWSECHEAWEGLWPDLDTFWMNHPRAGEAAQHKIFQLRVAQRVGLSVPETLVTNDPGAAADFLDRCAPEPAVRKAFRNLEAAPRLTALVREEDRALLPLVRQAPVIFQRFVPAVADLRVTAVGDELFAAEFRSGADHQVDYRAGIGSAQVRAHRLPDEVEAALQRLQTALGLSYGAIDLRLTPDGEYVFLEVNPAGEYLFVTERTGQRVPQAIAAALSRGTS